MEASDLGPPLVGDRLAVLWVDQRGKPTACSSAFTQLFGDPERLKPRDARGEALPRAQWPQARARRGDSFCSALKLELADGTRKLFNVSGYQLFGCGEKSAAGSVLIFEEAGRMDEPGHVAALVSHELRTPLTVLLAALQLMERSLAGGDGGAARRYLAEALAETRHLNVLTGELVEAARLSNGELQLRRQELGLAALVRDVCVRAQELTRGQRLQLTETVERDDVDPQCQRRLGPVLGRQDDRRCASLARGLGDRQRTVDRPGRAVERQLPGQRDLRQPLPLQLAGGAEQRRGDRQVHPGPGLAQARRGEVDDDPAQRKFEAAVDQRRPNPLARLPDGGVGEADDREARQAAVDVYLDPDRAGGDAVEGESSGRGEHDKDAKEGVRKRGSRISIS
jgi:hypothetical protein